MKPNASFALLSLVACVLAAAAYAQDSAPTSPTPAASGTSPVPAGEVGSKPGEGSAPPAPSKSSPQHFEPTEKVRPDFDVAFPVDI